MKVSSTLIKEAGILLLHGARAEVLESAIPKAIVAMTLLEFVPQCCDAGIYLKMGRHCAEQGICYNDLRPMGAVYWFSLPYRLGLPPASLIVGHYLLLALSVILSVFTARSIHRNRFGLQTSPLKLGITLLCSLAIHMAFLFPVLHTSLSDAPASLSALIATWLLLGLPETGKRRIVMLGLAGLALGLATWLRAFFLYPVLIILGIWLLQILRKGWQWRELALLTAIIPIAIQYAATYNTSKHVSYLDPQTHQGMYHEHIESLITGYDTILPFDYHTSYSFCEHYASLPDALRHFDLYSLYCLFGGRLYFYLGSYSPYPYLPPFEHKLSEMVLPDYQPLSADPLAASDLRENFVLEPATAISFADEQNQKQTIHAQKLWKPNPLQDARFTQKVYLERGNIYRLRATLWSESDIHYIHLTIAEHDSQKIVADTGAMLTPFKKPNLPNESFVDTRIDKNGFYDISISSNILAETTPLAKAAAEIGLTFNIGTVYIWNVSLAKIPLATPETRWWSVWLFILNGAALLGALFMIREIIGHKDAPGIVVAILALLTLGASLCILPEQRFVIYPMITLWFFTINWLTRRIG